MSNKSIRADRILIALDQFLEPSGLDSVRTCAMRMEDRFSAATTLKNGRPLTLDVAVRHARVLTDVETGEVGKWFKARVEQVLPSVLEELELPVRKPKRVAVQITSTGDGGFYKPHTDNSVHTPDRRLLSFVYFCNRYPVSFQGGELRIYGTLSHAELHDPGVQVHVISPEQNRIVFFLSDYVHEICPVVCKSSSVADTRLTVNGWIYFE